MLTNIKALRLAFANQIVKGLMKMMPLSLAGVGEQNTVKRIGGSPEVKQHLENLGSVVASTVTIVNTLGGNVIVNVKESRIAISEEMARKIMV